MAPRDDRGGPVGLLAVEEQQVRTDREHRIRNALVPLDVFGPGDVGAGVAVPGAAGKLRGIPPGGVRDHVAVVAEQRLDDGEDPRVGEGGLGQRAAVEHLVAELVGATPLRGIRHEDRVDLTA